MSPCPLIDKQILPGHPVNVEVPIRKLGHNLCECPNHIVDALATVQARQRHDAGLGNALNGVVGPGWIGFTRRTVDAIQHRHDLPLGVTA
jgi:hypothetical protein